MRRRRRSFGRSIADAGASPPPPERAAQEIALFAFFSAGQSALECLGSALYVVGAIAARSGFDLTPDKVWLEDVAGAYGSSFEGERLAGELRALVASTGLREWRAVRNVLTHRESPARHHFVGVSDSLALAPGRTEQGADWLGGPLSAATTADQRAWLASELENLLAAANDFAQLHLRA